MRWPCLVKKKKAGPYKGVNDDLHNLGDDFKKVGTDIKDIYTKLGYKIPKKASRGIDLPKILLIIALISLVIIPVIGVPVALILISVALYILWQNP